MKKKSLWIQKIQKESLLYILGFVSKIQLHATHATANLCSCLRQVACDTTYATCIYNVNIHVHPYIPIQM